MGILSKQTGKFGMSCLKIHRELVSGSFLIQVSTGTGGEVCSFVLHSYCWDWWQVQVI